MPAEWYYTTNKQQMGPVSWDELRQLASKDLLKPDDLVWTDGMAEWVKAVRQQGLFQENSAPATGVTAERRELSEAAPPRKSSARRRIDEELDEIDDEDRRKRRKARKGSGNGLKIGLIIGAVVLVLLMLVCGVGGVLLIVFGFAGGARDGGPVAGGGAVRGGGGGVAGGAGGGGGIVVARGAVTYTLNLAPGTQNERPINFSAGQRVTITVTTNRVAGAFQPDVDLYVFHRGQLIASDIRVHPDCSVSFVAPANDSYTVRVQNLGPGMASSRVDARW